MSIISPDCVRLIADQNDVALADDDSAAALALDLETHLRLVIQESLQFMNHSNRSRLTVDDVSKSLRVLNIEPVLGFSGREPVRFKKETIASSSIVTLEAGGSTAPGTSSTGGASAAPPGTYEVYSVEDDEVNLSELLSIPLPPLPIEISYTAHWLAVEGVQPAIPQNPTPIHVDSSKPLNAEALSTDERVEVKPLVKHVLSPELRAYYDRMISCILQPDEAIRDSALQCLASDSGIHPLIPYLSQFITGTVSSNVRHLPVLRSMIQMVAAILSNPGIFIEPYLHQLMPAILTCLVGKTLCADPAKDDHWSLREAAADVVKTIIVKYGRAYHTLQPRISRTLRTALFAGLTAPGAELPIDTPMADAPAPAEPNAAPGTDATGAGTTAAATATATTTTPATTPAPAAAPAAASARPLTTRFGALRGLEALGPESVRLHILPFAAALAESFQAQLADRLPADAGDRERVRARRRDADARRCLGALVDTVGRLLRRDLQQLSALELRAMLAGEGGTGPNDVSSVKSRTAHLIGDSQLAGELVDALGAEALAPFVRVTLPGPGGQIPGPAGHRGSDSVIV
ncbi:hypothetical protein H696_03716 [Fonticula alba]|uniref:TATA box binding protein associated factor (TAF) histone-like fold domain-containing protein n=1 Tax=Fonticula alba TaxID=691883 RepID=A0A058Z573_FONAL|nr:hypothetical protein H696_03716 [Fonticula alba]KCV69281.1 hypothetical protein H696_03716 [Fonticula alba]|eukprot:XP_009495846.1 hypothetical protein H696_03716 [Fonticula alba]